MKIGTEINTRTTEHPEPSTEPLKPSDTGIATKAPSVNTLMEHLESGKIQQAKSEISRLFTESGLRTKDLVAQLEKKTSPIAQAFKAALQTKITKPTGVRGFISKFVVDLKTPETRIQDAHEAIDKIKPDMIKEFGGQETAGRSKVEADDLDVREEIMTVQSEDGLKQRIKELRHGVTPLDPSAISQPETPRTKPTSPAVQSEKQETPAITPLNWESSSGAESDNEDDTAFQKLMQGFVEKEKS